MSGFTDQYGRAVSFSTDGTTDTYAGGGITVSFPAGAGSQARALNTFNSMAPPGAIATPTPITIDAADFIARLTPAEQAAIVAADPLWAVKVAAAGTINVTDPVVIANANAAVAAGLLTAARAAQILNLAVTSP